MIWFKVACVLVFGALAFFCRIRMQDYVVESYGSIQTIMELDYWRATQERRSRRFLLLVYGLFLLSAIASIAWISL